MVYDDGVIDPRDTRTVLGICLSVIENAPDRGHRPLRRLPGCDAAMPVDRRSTGCWSPTAARSPAGSSATCRDLGIGTVAVHSDADAGLPFVREADVAVRLPGSTPAETYLRGDLLVAAALSAGADAVHPGYGFLSENADFARQVIDAGLTWVGPPPESMEQMASKVAAKKLMARGRRARAARADPGRRHRGRPAPAGEGVRGRRRPRHARRPRARRRWPARSSRPRAEAASAFGDATVFCEPYVEHGRHVEVQVLGDTHGTVVRARRPGLLACSAATRRSSRRRPPPGSPSETRAALHAAARAAAEAIGYVGAGTVEFLYDEADRRFWFLEMNTRLQVEHPVTECVTGLDLVEQQLAVAEGGRLAATRPAAGRARRRGAALRRGPGARLAAAERPAHPLRRAGRRSRSSGRCRATGSGSTPGSAPATRSAPTTTRCSPR